MTKLNFLHNKSHKFLFWDEILTIETFSNRKFNVVTIFQSFTKFILDFLNVSFILDLCGVVGCEKKSIRNCFLSTGKK